MPKSMIFKVLSGESLEKTEMPGSRSIGPTIRVEAIATRVEVIATKFRKNPRNNIPL